jgi:hypothetical protein
MKLVLFLSHTHAHTHTHTNIRIAIVRKAPKDLKTNLKMDH